MPDYANFARGIDVSTWQRAVNWAQVKAAGITFVYVKSTEGVDVVDRFFAEHWQGVQAAGLLYGVYHFFQPHLDPYAQAAFWAQTINYAPGPLPPALDIEDTRTLVDNTTRVRNAEICLTEIERLLNRRPLIYTGPNFWNTCMAIDGQPPAWSANYEVWLANYLFSDRPPTPTELDKFRPWVPSVWNTWKVWQYTGLGTLAGVNGNVDIDLFNGSVDDLRQWAGVAQRPSPDPEPLPAVTNQQMINAIARTFGAGYWNNVVVRAGLTHLAEARQAFYAGPPIGQIPNLTEAEKEALRQALAAFL